MDLESTSPSGRYGITVRSWEVRMSLWVDSPTVTDLETGRKLLAFVDSHWSLDEATWLGEDTVELWLRKYPGSHTPSQVKLTVDCRAATAEAGGEMLPLSRVEPALDRMLSWPQVRREAPGGFRGLMRRLYRLWRGQR